MVCQISGTTNAKSKFIPVSNEAFRGLSLQRQQGFVVFVFEQ
jgi:hypothetical protein